MGAGFISIVAIWTRGLRKINIEKLVRLPLSVIESGSTVTFPDCDPVKPMFSYTVYVPGLRSTDVEPGAVMALARELFGATAEARVLGIRGYAFDDFGEGLSDRARANLAAAVDFLAGAIRGGHLATAATAGGSGASWSEG